MDLHPGKGPEKEKYEEKIRRLSLKRVAFRTAWLSAEDYPLLLGRLLFQLLVLCSCCCTLQAPLTLSMLYLYI